MLAATAVNPGPALSVPLRTKLSARADADMRVTVLDAGIVSVFHLLPGFTLSYTPELCVSCPVASVALTAPLSQT